MMMRLHDICNILYGSHVSETTFLVYLNKSPWEHTRVVTFLFFSLAMLAPHLTLHGEYLFLANCLELEHYSKL